MILQVNVILRIFCFWHLSMLMSVYFFIANTSKVESNKMIAMRFKTFMIKVFVFINIYLLSYWVEEDTHIKCSLLNIYDVYINSKQTITSFWLELCFIYSFSFIEFRVFTIKSSKIFNFLSILVIYLLFLLKNFCIFRNIWYNTYRRVRREEKWLK